MLMERRVVNVKEKGMQIKAWPLPLWSGQLRFTRFVHAVSTEAPHVNEERN